MRHKTISQELKAHANREISFSLKFYGGAMLIVATIIFIVSPPAWTFVGVGVYVLFVVLVCSPLLFLVGKEIRKRSKVKQGKVELLECIILDKYAKKVKAGKPSDMVRRESSLAYFLLQASDGHKFEQYVDDPEFHRYEVGNKILIERLPRENEYLKMYRVK